MHYPKKTNLAVTIDYEPERMLAPALGLSGTEEVARLMKRLALRYGIPIEENNVLAEKLFSLGMVELPEGFYGEIANLIIKSATKQE